MRKPWTAICLLAVIVGFCWWSTWHVDQICRDTSALLEQAERYCTVGEFSKGMEQVAGSWNIWNRHEGFLGMALRHTESDDVGILFPSLLESCRQRDLEEFNRRNLELMATISHLSRMEIPYYFNVL